MRIHSLLLTTAFTAASLLVGAASAAAQPTRGVSHTDSRTDAGRHAPAGAQVAEARVRGASTASIARKPRNPGARTRDYAYRCAR